VINFALVPGVRARVARLDGDLNGALGLIRTGVSYATGTDDVVLRALVQLELAEILGELGQRHDAAAEGRTALELYEAKGDQPGMAATQVFLNALEGPR
jgi:hypothetical protein